VNRAAAEEDENERAKAFGQQRAESGGHRDCSNVGLNERRTPRLPGSVGRLPHVSSGLQRLRL
jgi:hypothetical protein